jgi:N-acetylglucosamine kinase-like BadF-type ATPase
VILACGTGGAIAARNAQGGFWHSGFWAAPLGGGAIGRLAIQAAVHAELGLTPATSLAGLLTAHFGVADVEALVRRHNGRGTRGLTDAELSRLAPLVLDAAAAGDSIARGIVADQAALMAAYGRAAARGVGLAMTDAPVVLAGGVFRHESGLMTEMIRQHLAEDCAAIVLAEREPAIGALVLAFEAAGVAMTPARLDAVTRTAPPPAFYRTAG